MRQVSGNRGNSPRSLQAQLEGMARHITTLDIGDGETVYQCVDCGAFVVVKEEPCR